MQPSQASMHLPFAYGSQLGRGGAPAGATLGGRFFAGRLEAVVKAWILFFSGEWKKTLVSWDGVERSWHLGSSGGGEITPFAGSPSPGAIPNMVTLPSLDLGDPPTSPIPAELANQLIGRILGRGHDELDLEGGWLVSGPDQTRCFIPPG